MVPFHLLHQWQFSSFAIWTLVQIIGKALHLPGQAGRVIAHQFSGAFGVARFEEQMRLA